MCFSPEASFTASAVLISTGIVCIAKVKHKSYYLLACIPLVFGLQQFCEGILWLAMQNHKYQAWRRTATSLFAGTGQLIWPVMVPIAVLTPERDRIKRNILRLFCFIGIGMSTYLGANLIRNGVEVYIINHHIYYEFDFPHTHNPLFSGMVYIIPTVLSHFVSGNSRLKLLGLAVLASLVVTRLFYIQYSFSVWCFFAAIMSTIIYFVIREPVKDLNDTHVAEPIMHPPVKKPF